MTTLIAAHTQSTYPIHELYKRLNKAGFDQPFVRRYVLPDWWEDALSSNPATRSIAEVHIARMVGVSIKTLRTSDAPLEPSHSIDFRLKQNKNIEVDELKPAIMLAQALGSMFAKVIEALPDFRSDYKAIDVRQRILRDHASVDLAGLLDWCWEHGIIVAHLRHLPKRTKRFSGIAMLCDERPVIVLADKRDGPPWLAFHLAHELGHILLGHVRSGQTLVDDQIDWRIESDDLTQGADYAQCESEANEFAVSLLTAYSQSDFEIDSSLTADKLASTALRIEQKYTINAGTWALIHGYLAGRIPAAQGALKILGLDTGAHQLIADRVKRHLPDDVPEALTSFLPLINCE